MQKEYPGIAFEKAVAAIQRQIDPAAHVTHNETLIDRLGHARQFDVVIRGNFAGQQMLGIIECKDQSRKVGTPEIDALITKAQDINANFKILMSKTGFSKPAIEKCAHYGIQALSLLTDDPINRSFFVGTRWTADLHRWSKISISLDFVNQPNERIEFSTGGLKINGMRIQDWYTNYLLNYKHEYHELGWIAGINVTFDKPQFIEIDSGEKYLCLGVYFNAERICEKLEYIVGISGTGFFNWNSKKATFPPGVTVKTDPVPTDFSQWSPRSDENKGLTGFIEFHIMATSIAFEHVDGAINLEIL